MTVDALPSAVFLDRDGVINVDHGYVFEWDDFHFMPGAISGMARLSAAGIPLIVVTNQSGIGRGYYSEQKFAELCRRVASFLDEHGVAITATYHCPHHPTEAVGHYRLDCLCRKPRDGMLRAAARDLQLDLERCAILGDKSSDMEAGRRAGLTRLYQLSADDVASDCVRVASIDELASALLPDRG